ncbi:ERAP1-like C-terminal domain-containing protein [Hamiltosporidium magnivora]|uniref:ERAP1-like C-terminal domain-containing protein n=1 Tax=Hamiltosporidium magnivora TaxID=148818 RepID=A0A4Q9LP10_9MICR|nr:ERAP1-like C-terminal domain-containing protein [Hamiltosporidium magnivora]
MRDQWTINEEFPYISVEVVDENHLKIEYEGKKSMLVALKNKKDILGMSDFKNYPKVNYVLCNEDLLYKINGMLEEKLLEPRDRLNIINDFFSLTLANNLQFNDFLSFVRYFQDEENYEILSSILEGLNEFQYIFLKK